MKNQTLLTFLILLIGSLLSGYFGPWWAPAVYIVIVTVLIKLQTRQAILISALALGLVYAGMACIMSLKDETDLLRKTGQLLGGLSPVGLTIVTTVIGTLTGLLSGWLGNALGSLLRKES